MWPYGQQGPHANFPCAGESVAQVRRPRLKPAGEEGDIGRKVEQRRNAPCDVRTSLHYFSAQLLDQRLPQIVDSIRLDPEMLWQTA